MDGQLPARLQAASSLQRACHPLRHQKLAWAPLRADACVSAAAAEARNLSEMRA